MVLIMTMTPLHMTMHGHGLTAVGLVISAHTFGMFALSPLSGRLTSRSAASGSSSRAWSWSRSRRSSPRRLGRRRRILFLALFLLGYGWNLGYVAGSTMLTTSLPLAEQTRIEGVTDSLIWSSAAAASLGSGLVVAAASYAVLGLLGAALVIVPVWIVLARRRAVEAIGSAEVTPGRQRPRRRVPGGPASRRRTPRPRRAAPRRRCARPDVARTEDHAWRAAAVDEQLHVRAVGLAEERRTAAGLGLDDRGSRDRQRMIGQHPRGPNRPPVISTVAGCVRRKSSAAQAA